MSPNQRRKTFESWVREYHADVYRAAYRILLQSEDAQDVTQDVFVDALARFERIADADSVGSVLCWMAFKKALTHLRGDRRRSDREQEAAAMKKPHEDAQVTFEQDASTHLQALLKKLPEELRIALTLRYQEGHTFAEMSEVLAISPPSAHDRVHRALEKLRHWMKRSAPSVLALDLETLLRDTPAPPVPAGLSDRLLSLEALRTGGTTLAAKVLWTSVALLGIGAGWVVFSEPSPTDMTLAGATLEDDSDDSIPSHSGGVSRREESRSDQAREQLPGPASHGSAESVDDAAFATISGRVLQPDHTPAGGVLVIADNYYGTGRKIEIRADSARTDELGHYSLRVPVRHTDGEDYALHVRYDHAILTESVSLRVHAEEERLGFDLKLPFALEERNGEFSLDLELANEQGELLPQDTIVTLERLLATVGGGEYPHWEGGGRLNVAGRITFAGEKLGPKRISARHLVDNESYEYRGEFKLEEGGTQSLRLELDLHHKTKVGGMWPDPRQAKFQISGTMAELETGAPVKRVFHDIWYVRVPEMSPHDILHDFLPNHIFRAPFQSASMGEQPPETEEFYSHELAAGRYIAIGHDSPYAPTFSAVVELTEETPKATGIELLYESPGTLRGIVRDVDGEPLADAVLCVTGTGTLSDDTIEGMDELVRKSNGEGTYRAAYWRTKADGSFEITGFPSQVPVRIVALSPRRDPASSQTVFVNRGATLDGVDIRFTRERKR